MKSSILDKNGNNFIIKSSDAPNLDSNFWKLENIKNYSVNNILNQPYSFHVWVHSCVRTIAQNVSQIERNLTNKKNEEVNNDHDVVKLMQKPNKMMDYKTFFYNVICKLLLPAKKGDNTSGGQCFIIPWNGTNDQPVQLDKGEIPDELMPFSEEFFSPWYIKSTRGMNEVKGWIFEIPGISQSKIFFEHSQIIRIYLPNPYDILKGLSDFTSIAQTIELDAKSDLFNENIFENFGRLDGQVTTEQVMDQSELDKYKEKWYQQYTGVKQKRVAFLSGGLKYEQFGLSSVDLQYIEQSKWNRQKVLAGYGLNRIAVGDYEDINMATIREGRKLLWYDRYIPLDGIIVDTLNGQWIYNIDNGTYKYASDYSKIIALQSDMKEKAQTGGEMCTRMGFPPELAARILGIPLKKEDLIKWPHLSEQINTMNSTNTTEQTLSIKSKKSILNDKQIYSNRYIKTILEPVELKFRKELDRFFINQRNSILDKVDELVKEQKMILLKGISISGYQFLPDEANETFKLLGMYKQAVKLQTALEKKQVENELKHGIEWDTNSTKIDYWVSIRGKYVRDINTATFRFARDAINATVKQGTDEGITVQQMRERIKQAIHDVYEVRTSKPIVPNGLFDLGGMSSSRTIARTEMGSIASLTRVDIFKSEGIEKIEWITAEDEKVRETHVLCGQEAPISFGDVFVNGLKYPREQGGPPEEVINCRCSFVAVIGD